MGSSILRRFPWLSIDLDVASNGVATRLIGRELSWFLAGLSLVVLQLSSHLIFVAPRIPKFIQLSTIYSMYQDEMELTNLQQRRLHSSITATSFKISQHCHFISHRVSFLNGYLQAGQSQSSGNSKPEPHAQPVPRRTSFVRMKANLMHSYNASTVSVQDTALSCGCQQGR